MIPRTLQEWTLDTIVELVDKRVFESETFDFKEMLPHKKEPSGKDRLSKLCAAFANSDGGFIIFGISDKVSVSSSDRLVGIEPDLDFPEHFGSYAQKCHPSVYWRFRNPPIRLTNGRLIHIVQIPKSWNAPHAVGDGEKGWYFEKRTNKGNEPMSIEEVRVGFLGYYEKRLKLQLLRSELKTLYELAGDGYIADPSLRHKMHSMVSFDMSIIESVLSDSFTILANHADLLESLSALRIKTRVANNAIHGFLSTAAIKLTDSEGLNREHNDYLEHVCISIQQLCRKAIKELDVILDMNP
ncbi:MAG: ATP-binding protein [Caldilineaceae bacterium]|nr:ATP-binding protein [Caldilineaceae bacterium]MBP8106632.1 ATP-binding protein [Caldilineaceae bacterium]MBP8124251.1 ATP-binding protein [Caldilineaceae bacterium]MBP9070905.1 ATP-binding protein [Caldilineaceae bacterium]